jgi:hypothetical protein
MDDPFLDDDTSTIEEVARNLIRRFGPDAALYARERAEIAAEQGAAFNAEIWHDVADTVDRLN